MGKRSQSFGVGTHIIIVSLSGQFYLFFRLTVGTFAFFAAVGFLAYC